MSPKADKRTPRAIANWQLRRVRPYPENPRIHTEAEVARLAEFIRAVGFLNPIEVDEAGVILTGHRRRDAAKLLGLRTVPVIQHKHLSDAQKRAYRIADNQLTIEGEWDRAKLHSEATALNAGGFELGLQGLGFSDAEVRDVLDNLPAEPKERRPSRSLAVGETPEAEPETPETPEKPISELGDLWELGEHRLLCGDSLKPENLTKLLGKARADMVFTDPPYAIYGSSTGVASDIMDDKMVRPFFRDVLTACASSCRAFAHIYVCCDWRSWASWWEVGKGTGIVPKNMVVWDKQGGGLGASYANCHELLLFAWFKPLRKNMSQKITGGRQVNDSNIWRVHRVPAARTDGKGGGREHNAQKPVDLVKRALENSSDEGEALLDLFVGAGTSFVACQETGRRCYGVEIDPRYCDVSVRRWQAATGLAAKLQATGATFEDVAAERER